MSLSLPTPGTDLGTWGGLLNEWLLVALNADGTLLAEPWLRYTGNTPALGSLEFSVSNTTGTDGFGNAWLAGVTVYTLSSGVYSALNLWAGQLTFYHATAPGGAWTADVVISDLTGNKLKLSSTAEDWVLSFGTNLVTIDSVDTHGTDLFLNHGGNLRANQPGSPGTVEEWHTANLLNGWTDEGTGQKISYQKISSPPNSLFIFGNLGTGTVTDYTTVATLPSAYAPASNKWLAASTDAAKQNSSNNTYSEGPSFRIDTSGNVDCYGFASIATRAAFSGIIALDW